MNKKFPFSWKDDKVIFENDNIRGNVEKLSIKEKDIIICKVFNRNIIQEDLIKIAQGIAGVLKQNGNDNLVVSTVDFDMVSYSKEELKAYIEGLQSLYNILIKKEENDEISKKK